MPEDSFAIDDLEVGVDYAVAFRSTPQRPLLATVLIGDDGSRQLCVHHPDPEIMVISLWTEADFAVVRLLGRWDDPSGVLDMTWQGLAKHAYGEVLRQRDLVARLARVGIVRSPEPYVLDEDSPNAVRRSMILNFDELDQLLRAANA
jgi:hypothetical protein